jgi:Tol biopolymer transport system component
MAGILPEVASSRFKLVKRGNDRFNKLPQLRAGVPASSWHEILPRLLYNPNPANFEMGARMRFLSCVLTLVSAASVVVAADLPKLQVSDNRRFLITADGKPFFYLGDTGWELFHRLDRADADKYLAKRASQGFTVIQAVAIAEFDGHTVPNAYGHLPLVDLDPAKPAVKEGPANDYWDHVDYVVDRANANGLYVGFLPTWGRYWHSRQNDAKQLFNKQNAELYGEWLGKRYKDKGIIWILGGDRPCDTPEQQEIIRAMAKGLKKGDGGRNLMTFHPNGGQGSSKWFHATDWLSFNMRQNGHGTEYTGRYDQTRADYDRKPVKPVLDGEPIYEGHPISFNAKNLGHSVAADIRRAFYWDVFNGAFGHTYGHHSVWGFWKPGVQPINDPLMPWTEAIEQPGANQMIHGRRLMESRPFLTRVPDDTVIATDCVATSVPGAGRSRYAATRDEAGTFAMVYVPIGRAFKVKMDRITGTKVKAWWFNPRTGTAREIGDFENTGEREFIPPHVGELLDWVLVLDDAAKNYPPPGQTASVPPKSKNRTLLITSVRTGDTEIFAVDPDTGDAQNLSRSPKSEDRYPCWSPDGKRVAFTSNRDGPFNLYAMDADGGNVRRLVDSKAVCYMPSWQRTSDGERIVFGMHGDKPEMASVKPDGSDLKMLGDGHDPTISPDGKHISYTGHADGGVSVFVMDLNGDNKKRIVQEVSRVGATFPNWSPDGRRIVYSFPVGEALELFIIDANGANNRQLTKLNRVATPAAWSPDGEWISFRLTDERYWSDEEKMKKAYAEKPTDKRPVWVVKPDGSNAHVIESLRFQCAMDGSRAAWKPTGK